VTEERRNWPRFGKAATETREDSVSVQQKEDIPFERVRQLKATQQEKKFTDMQQAMQSADKSAIVGSLKDMLYKRRMERELLRAKGLLADAEKPPEEDGKPGGLPSAPKPGSYVPPRCVWGLGGGAAGRSGGLRPGGAAAGQQRGSGGAQGLLAARAAISRRPSRAGNPFLPPQRAQPRRGWRGREHAAAAARRELAARHQPVGGRHRGRPAGGGPGGGGERGLAERRARGCQQPAWPLPWLLFGGH
jgi:hypothetical protein